MRGLRTISAIAFASAIFASPTFAAPACGPLAVITSLDLVPVSGGRPGVTAAIVDKPVTLLVDTGSPFSMIARQLTRELNLAVGPARIAGGQGRVEVRNVAGQRSEEQARLPSITLGRLRQEGVYFFVDPADRPTGRGSFDGIIGADMLTNVDADFDFGAKKLNLISQNHCDGKVVYWAAPALATIPFHFDKGGHIAFPLRLDDKRVNAMLDTGAYNTVLNLNIARRTFNVDTNAPDVEKIGELQGGFTANVYRKQFKTITLDGVTVTNPAIDLLPDMVSNPATPTLGAGSIIRDTDANLPDVILGMNVLSKLHVYIAYKEAKLYITAAGSQPAAAPQGQPAQ
jgi:predicted aspartyl protease